MASNGFTDDRHEPGLGIRLGHGVVPRRLGREQLMGLGFVDRTEDLVLYGDVGCGKTHMAIATGMPACEGAYRWGSSPRRRW